MQHYLGCPVLWRFGVEKLGLVDPATPRGRITKLLLWDGAAADKLEAAAQLLAVGYKAYNVLQHRAAVQGQPQLDIHRLLSETLRLVQPTGTPTPPAPHIASGDRRRRRANSQAAGGADRSRRRRDGPRRPLGEQEERVRPI